MGERGKGILYYCNIREYLILYYIILFPNAKRDISHGRHKNICILREEKRKKEGVKKVIPQIGHTSLSGGGVLLSFFRSTAFLRQKTSQT